MLKINGVENIAVVDYYYTGDNPPLNLKTFPVIVVPEECDIAYTCSITEPRLVEDCNISTADTQLTFFPSDGSLILTTTTSTDF